MLTKHCLAKDDPQLIISPTVPLSLQGCMLVPGDALSGVAECTLASPHILGACSWSRADLCLWLVWTGFPYHSITGCADYQTPSCHFNSLWYSGDEAEIIVIAAALYQNTIGFWEVVIHALLAKANGGQSSSVMSWCFPKCHSQGEIVKLTENFQGRKENLVTNSCPVLALPMLNNSVIFFLSCGQIIYCNLMITTTWNSLPYVEKKKTRKIGLNISVYLST